MHAHEVRSHEMHAHEVHAYEMYACEVHAHPSTYWWFPGRTP